MARAEIAYSLVADEAVMEGLAATGEDMESNEEDLKRCGGSPNKRHFEPEYEAQLVVGDWLLTRAGGRLFGPMGVCPNAKALRERFSALSPTRVKRG